MRIILRLLFRGFIFVPEHISGSEMSFFNLVYELSDKGEKLYFDNPLGDPCETSENEAINTFLEEVLGVIKRVIKSYGVKPGEIGAIISLKTLDPALNISRKTREKEAMPLLEFIENLEKGEKSG